MPVVDGGGASLLCLCLRIAVSQPPPLMAASMQQSEDTKICAICLGNDDELANKPQFKIRFAGKEFDFLVVLLHDDRMKNRQWRREGVGVWWAHRKCRTYIINISGVLFSCKDVL
jgi:hypothetical protein